MLLGLVRKNINTLINPMTNNSRIQFDLIHINRLDSVVNDSSMVGLRDSISYLLATLAATKIGSHTGAKGGA